MLDPDNLGIIQEEFGVAPPSYASSTRRRQQYTTSQQRHHQPQPSTSGHHHQHQHQHHLQGGDHLLLGGGRRSGSASVGAGREKEKMKGKKEKKFLREVQEELEEQRGVWKDEVDRLMSLNVGTPPGTSHGGRSGRGGRHHNTSFSSDPGSPNSASSNSYVDTSSGNPIFRAFVDVSDFPARGIHVSVDKIQNKVVVEARKAGGAEGTLTRSFTQKVQLPRYADDQRVRSRLAKDGVLMIEVPLMFYFPQEKKPSKSFVNQVKTRPDGSKVLEILVNVGQDISPTDLKVKVNSNDELLILAENSSSIGGATLTSKNKLIKRYILPKNADTSSISSRLGNDGRLVVVVPIYKDSSMLF